MHRFLVPPEALEPTEAHGATGGADAPPTTKKPWLWTANGVAVTSLLVVSVSVAAAVTLVLAPVVVPCTAFVAYGFWYAGRRITRLRDMALYCLVGGAMTGAANAWLTLGLWSTLGGGYFLRDLEVDMLELTAWIGAASGIAYGFAYLLPLLIQLSVRPLLRTEAVDRSLVSYGLWGVLVLGLGLGLVAGTEEATQDLLFSIGAASFMFHLLMSLLGTVSWARRRWWLGRVARGKVSGWLVCDAQRFPATELEGLQLFSTPLLARPPANKLRVLACGDGTEAYRSTPLIPKYLVC